MTIKFFPVWSDDKAEILVISCCFDAARPLKLTGWNICAPYLM